MYSSRTGWIGTLVGAVLLPGALLAAAPAIAALPNGYTVQRIDTPVKSANAGFGNQSISIGDATNDGKDDFVVLVHTGTLSNAGTIFQFSGASPATPIRQVNAGDVSTTRGATGLDNFLGRMSDIGSCPNAPTPDPAQAGPTCASAVIGPKDGVNEILIGASGIDFPNVPDVGRAYVLDGRTLAILKRIDMPQADRDLIQARIAENPIPATGANDVRGGFGRTVTNPRGMPPCVGNSGINTCPDDTQMAPAVRIGDVDGQGQPDIIVGANFFPETGTTAHPDSQCARDAGTTTCIGAGRAYLYRGEDIVNTSPQDILSTPLRIFKNIGAQTDDPFAGRTGHWPENFAHSQFPIGDVGSCSGVTSGNRCPVLSRGGPDGKPDFVISTHRSECPLFAPDYSYFECGASVLYDGATGAILYIYNHPEPQANALFGFTTGQQFPVGDLGDSSAPDVVIPAMQNVGTTAEAGRGYVFSGNVGANMINFAFVDDPTPNTFGRFTNPTEGVGDLVGGSQVKNEVLAGQFSAVQTPNKADTKFDVSFVNPANEQALQTISDPDDQPESGFGSRLFPMGDLNGDGFLDFAVASVRWDGFTPTVLDAGRLYIFTSNANAAPPAPPALPAGPQGPAGTTGAAGPAGPAGPAGGAVAAALAGRTVDLDASRETVRRNAPITLRGVVEAFANPEACEGGQSVQLQRRALTATRFTTFQTVRTSAGGTFRSSQVRMARTQFFRARLLQTDACLGAQSARERVRVTQSRAAASKAARAAKARALRAARARAARLSRR